MKSTDIRTFILSCLKEKKATQIKSIDISAQSTIAHFMIICNGRSVKNISAIAEYVTLQLKHKMQIDTMIEGPKGASWILIDVGSIIVHLFHDETRENLNIEKLWETNNNVMEVENN